MSLKNKSLVVKENESHVCSAQSDSISSLQIDKRVKFRSYSSQFTLSDQVIVAIDRREEFRAIEDTVIVEVDLSNGICNDIRSATETKYLKTIRLDEMAYTNPWIKKMITYDVFVDKDVMKSIRDEAMEPNKLYLLKHKHKQETSESLAGNYLENREFPENRKLRTTAAQFNPTEYNKKSYTDEIVSLSSNDNSLNVYTKSKSDLRNELIIRTGEYINRPFPNDQDKYSSSLSINLTTHKIPQIVSTEDLTVYDDEHSNTLKPSEKENLEQSTVETALPENERKNLEIDDIPFAEESEVNDHDEVDYKRNTISKSLQYFLPVFESNQNNPKPNESCDSENSSNYSRDAVTTDENESVDRTDRIDRPTLQDEEDYESLNADEFDESITENKHHSVSSLNENENNSISSERNSYSFDRSIEIDDVICQENLVMHINQNTDNDIVNIDELPKSPKLDLETKFPLSQFNIEDIKRNISSITTFHYDDFAKNKDLTFQKDFVEQRRDQEKKPKSPIHEIYVFNENEIESIRESYDSQSSMVIHEASNEDAFIFVKTKSFSLKRNSEKIEDYSNNDDTRMLICPTKDENISLNSELNNMNLNSISLTEINFKQNDNSTPKSLYSDRKEKFLNSNFYSSIEFFKPVSDDFKSPVETRSSTPSSEKETESYEKNDTSTNSSDNSMIVKDVSSDGAYEFPKNPKYEILDEELEDEMEKEDSDDSNNDISNIITSSEKIPNNDKNYSSSEDLSVYSSSTTVTVNEIILRDLVKTPIDSTPGYFEKFLKEREKRIPKDKNSINENSSFTDENKERVTLTKNENMVNETKFEDIIENTNESSYTEDTSSSSSDYPPRIIPILRQGGSIEDIAKYLNFPNKDNKGLKRSSGFDGNLDVVYCQEEDEKNLLYNDDINNKNFSTSSDDSMSLKALKDPQTKVIERTEEIIKQKVSDEKLMKKNKLSDHSSSENEYSDSTTQEESFQKYVPQEKSKRNDEMLITSKVIKQKSLPISTNDESDSSSDSRSTQSISTSTEEIQLSKTEKQSKFIDRGEKFPNTRSIKKQMSVPVSRNQQLLSSSNSDDSSGSVSTSENEICSNVIFTDRTEKQLNLDLLNKQKSFSVSKKSNNNKILSNLSKNSEGSKSFSTSEEENDTKVIESKSIDKEEKFPSVQSLNKKSFLSNSKRSLSHSSSNKSDSSRPISTSSDESQHSYVNFPQSKYIDKEEKFPSSQSIDKRIIVSNSKKISSSFSSVSSSSRSFTTSSDEDHSISEKKLSTTKHIEKVESNFTPTITAKEEISLPPKYEDSYSSNSSSDESLSIPIGKESYKKKNKTPNFQIDRREKFTKLDQTPQLSTNFKRAASVPNYLPDSTLDEDNQHEILSQSMKAVNTDPDKNNIAKNQKIRSFELLSAKLKDNSKKNSALSIDRREKFRSGEELDRITPCDNLKDIEKHDSDSDNSTSSYDSESYDDNLEDTQNVVNTPSHNPDEYRNEEKTNILQSIDRTEKFTDNNNLNNKLNNSKPQGGESESDDIYTSSSESSLSSTSSQTHSIEKKKNSVKTDHKEKFSKPENLEHQILKPKSKEKVSESPLNTLSSSSKTKSLLNYDNINNPIKSIEHQEKFAENNLENNIKKKSKNYEPVQNEQHDSSSRTLSSSNKSSKNNGNSDKVENSSIGKERPPKTAENEREEKFANQLKKHLKYGKSKMKSDSTDEDISFSLTSLPKDKHEIESDLNNNSVYSNDKEVIVADKINPESEIRNDDDQSISISSSTSTSENKKYNKNKYDKNERNTSRSYQTLPNGNIKIIPIKEKSKSLEPLSKDIFPSFSYSMPGSLGDIVERRYHECTETWSRQSPIGSDNLKKNQKKPFIDNEHISAVKNTDTFIKKKFNEPLTTRPRPVPSYLSPVNAFPYVPSDPEFSSADSLVNDYSTDYNANEVKPRYKSLPEFMKSLSTTSLPKEPIDSKSNIKKPVPKMKSPFKPINLDYGDIEDKKLPRQQFKKKTSITSVTTDSSYLEKPILKEKQPCNNYASSDSLSSLTVQSSVKQNAKLPPSKINPKPLNSNTRLNRENVSSTDSSSDSDTQIKSKAQSLKRLSYPSLVNSNINNRNQEQLTQIINGKQNYIIRTASLPQKIIPSSSESSEYSSSNDDDSAEIHHF